MLLPILIPIPMFGIGTQPEPDNGNDLLLRAGNKRFQISEARIGITESELELESEYWGFLSRTPTKHFPPTQPSHLSPCLKYGSLRIQPPPITKIFLTKKYLLRCILNLKTKTSLLFTFLNLKFLF